VTEATIKAKIESLKEQREQTKTMYQKFSGAIEAFEALIIEIRAESGATNGTKDTKEKAKVKK